eukprot:4073288-Alexandrium_andersonii.AAC.1
MKALPGLWRRSGVVSAGGSLSPGVSTPSGSSAAAPSLKEIRGVPSGSWRCWRPLLWPSRPPWACGACKWSTWTTGPAMSSP